MLPVLQPAGSAGAEPVIERFHDVPTVANLAFRVEELVAVAERAALNGDWLDVTLAAGGMLQGIDDEVAGTSTLAGRTAKTISKGSPRLAGWLMHAMRLVMHAADRTPLIRGARRDVAIVRAGLVEIAVDCARANGGIAVEDLVARVDDRLQKVGRLPVALRKAVVRTPSCFRSFDQHPRDVKLLVDRFVTSTIDRSRPLIVVGVRTSGSYLAPFVAANLIDSGFANVRVVSSRSEQPLSIDDEAIVRGAVAESALFLVTDDPPSSGYALRSVCRLLETYGVRDSDIELLLALFEGSEGVPEALSTYKRTVLLWEEWDIHRRMQPDAIKAALQSLFVSENVNECVVEPRAGSAGGRGHQRCLVHAVLTSDDGSNREVELVAEGAGIGYFARHDQVVAACLGGMAPSVAGVVDGVLFREHLSGPGVVPSIESVVEYVSERASALRVADDRSAELAGCQPVWEVAGEQLAKVYGKFWPVARALYVDRLVKKLLQTTMPAITDGRMQLDMWFDGGGIRKGGVSERTFGNLDLVSFDPAWDAVGFGMELHDRATQDRLREMYGATVEPLSPEKWLLYSLVRLWDDRRSGRSDRYETADRRSSVMRKYLAGAFLGDVEPNGNGPVVALDVDGVIESEVAGFKSPTPSSVLAIRALVRHGYRPVVATGRCVDDVVELVDLFKLSGGVAEYGSAIVLPDRSVESQLLDSTLELLDVMRRDLATAGDIRVDPRYRHSVRASTVTGSGRVKTLDESERFRVQRDGVRAVIGDLQTDFVGEGVDKSIGLDALLRRLGDERAVLAIGDTDADVRMLRLAAQSGVPAHASAEAKMAAKFVSRQPYQVGVAQIVKRLIGHSPGACETCAVTRLSPASRAMIDVLMVSEGSHSLVPARTIRAMMSAVRVQTSRAAR